MEALLNDQLDPSIREQLRETARNLDPMAAELVSRFAYVEFQPRIQEPHITIGHAMCQIIEAQMFPRSPVGASS